MSRVGCAGPAGRRRPTSPPPDRGRPRALGRGRPGRPPGAPRPPRARFEAAGIDAYFGVRREHMRYLTGFALADGEEKVAGNSGQFLVGGDEVVRAGRLALHDPGQPRGTGARIVDGVPRPAERAGRSWSASVGARRVGGRGGVRSRTRMWTRLAAAAPDVELVPVEGWVEADRAIKEPAELERVAAACAVADRALAALLPEIRPGVDRGRARAPLEWLIRTGGAEALAFDVACLAGPRRRCRTARPGDRPVLDGRGAPVRLRRAGGRLSQRHDPDAVRRRADGARPRRSTSSSRAPRRPPSRRSRRPWPAGAADGAAAADGRAIDADRPRRHRGRRPRGHFGHGTGHGIGLATHEAPNSACSARGGRCPGRPCSRSSRASISRARRACASAGLDRVDGAAGRAAPSALSSPREVLCRRRPDLRLIDWGADIGRGRRYAGAALSIDPLRLPRAHDLLFAFAAPLLSSYHCIGVIVLGDPAQRPAESKTPAVARLALVARSIRPNTSGGCKPSTRTPDHAPAGASLGCDRCLDPRPRVRRARAECVVDWRAERRMERRSPVTPACRTRSLRWKDSSTPLIAQIKGRAVPGLSLLSCLWGELILTCVLEACRA